MHTIAQRTTGSSMNYKMGRQQGERKPRKTYNIYHRRPLSLSSYHFFVLLALSWASTNTASPVSRRTAEKEDTTHVRVLFRPALREMLAQYLPLSLHLHQQGPALRNAVLGLSPPQAAHGTSIVAIAVSSSRYLVVHTFVNIWDISLACSSLSLEANR